MEPNGIRAALIEAGVAPTKEMMKSIAALGEAAIGPLLEVATDRGLWSEDSPGAGEASTSAISLLGDLRAPAAVEPLLGVLAETEPVEILHDRTLLALEHIGAPTLEPALRALAAIPAIDSDRRDELVGIVAALGVHDDRVLALLLEMLGRDPDQAAMHLARYGDPRALPHLLEALDRHAVAVDRIGRDSALIELVEAVEALGGTLGPAQAAKVGEFGRLREQWALPAGEEDGESLDDAADDDDESVRVPILRVERPGRNHHCWCGSGKKYKKCHLDADEAAEGSADDFTNSCDFAPEASEWLALDEGERIGVCLRAHVPLPDGHPLPGNLRLHALVHAVVETQLAMDDPPAMGRALDRLVTKGLDRHEATHALGAVLAKHLFPVLKGATAVDGESYARALDALTGEAPFAET